MGLISESPRAMELARKISKGEINGGGGARSCVVRVREFLKFLGAFST